MIHLRILTAVCLSAGLSCSLGCGPGSRTPPKPAFNPQAAAQQAFADFDSNRDGKLDKEELKKCPGLLHGLSSVDKDRDGTVTVEELAARLQHWSQYPGVLTAAHTEITLDDQPVADATVTLEPEKFLGPMFGVGNGTTDALGHVSFSGSVPGFPGVFFGYYRVRISKLVAGKETIPAKYNTESALGMEVADDVAPPRGFTEFHLQR